MNCRKIQKLTALYRKGELSKREKDLLQRHLEHCDACRKMLQEYHATGSKLTRLKSVHFLPADPERLTSRIMESVTAIKEKQDRNIVLSLLDRLLEYFMMPSLRYAMLACILAAVIGFSYQQYYIYSNMSRLENQLFVAGNSQPEITVRNEWNDCLRKSARHFSSSVLANEGIGKKLRDEISQDPKKLDHYMHLICRRKYRSLLDNLSQYQGLSISTANDIIPFSEL